MTRLRHYTKKGGIFWCVVAFFLLGMAPGFWTPSVAPLLIENGEIWLVPWAFLPSCLGALLSPLAFGALVDQRMNGERVMFWISLIGAAFLYFAFRSIAWGYSGWWFVTLMLIASFISAPMWSLLATIVMRPMEDPRKSFPLVRLAGTIGWIFSGFAVGYWLQLEASPATGTCAAVTRIVLAIACLMLPKTPPETVLKQRGWREYLGLEALSLMRAPNQRAFFLTTAFLSVPLAAFYPYAPVHLRHLGDTSSSATMAFGQISEILAMIFLAGILGRFRVKTVLLIALALSSLRYTFFAGASLSFSPWHLMLAGISLQGVIYAFFFVTGQVFMERRVPKAMRAQAQALLSVMSTGVGGIVGTLLSYVLYQAFAEHGDWTTFWSIQAGLCIMSAIYFFTRYRSPHS